MRLVRLFLLRIQKEGAAIVVPLKSHTISLNNVITVISLSLPGDGDEISEQYLCHIRESALLPGIIIAKLANTAIQCGFTHVSTTFGL